MSSLTDMTAALLMDHDRDKIAAQAVARVIESGDPERAYAIDTVEMVALASPDAAFDAGSSLRRAFRDLNDFKVSEFNRRVRGARERFKAATQKPRAPWESLLITGKNGDPKPILANAITALGSAPEWRGVLAFDEFSVRTLKRLAAPWGGEPGPWTDADDIRAAEWLQHHGITVSTGVASEAVQAVAHEAAFHPVRDWLNSLNWDGVPRIDLWLATYLGAEDTTYTRAVGSRWLISAVARVRQPGCQADHCLIAEGDQGSRKSSALRVLAGDERFSDQIADLHDKQASQDLQGKWIVEFGELAAMGRAEAGTLKGFLTRRVDHFRPAYGRRALDFPRQCIFAATTNLQSYLVDETGARRFWPVTCSAIDLEALKRDRDLLWAEARVRYEDGCPWWLEDRELVQAAIQQQGDRFEGDVWEDRIAAWLEAPTERRDQQGHPVADFDSNAESVTVGDVLAHAIGKRLDLWNQADKARVGRCLKALGWERYNARHGETREWRYRPKEGCQ